MKSTKGPPPQIKDKGMNLATMVQKEVKKRSANYPFEDENESSKGW